MLLRATPHSLLVFLTLLYIEPCQGASLTFVIDDTRSMDTVIDQVRREVDTIMNYVFDEKSSQISNIVLVTFNDPVVRLRKVTESRNDLKAALSSVRVNNYFNSDCPEMALSGVKLALESSQPGSYIYVFTDASAKDYHMNEEIQQLCQTKQSQVVFVLTGDCNRPYSKRFQVYYDIATASSGLAFRVDDNEIDAVLRTIHETIKGNKTVLSTRVTPPDVYTQVPFWIDDQTEYAIVSASGTEVSLQIHGPPVEMEKIMWTSHGKVVKLKDPYPGRFVATVRGTSATSVVIVGRSDLYFHHGFSEQEPKSLNETVVQPYSDSLTHLALLVSDPKHSVVIKSAQILDMKEHLLFDLTLEELSPNFYATKQFFVPSEMFKVAVIGESIQTGQSVKRIARIPVTPIKPPPGTPKSQAPVGEILEGASVEVARGAALTLTCKVSAFPEPAITWTNDKGSIMRSTSFTEHYPYDYISYLKIRSVSAAATYHCCAENARGEDHHAVDVLLKDSITIVKVPEGTTKIRYGTEYTLNCDVRSQEPLEIRWYHVNKDTGATEQVMSSNKYSIFSNGKKLRILSMDVDLVGKYTCKVHIQEDPDEKREFSTEVVINGLVAPNIDPDIEHLTVGEHMPTTIICKVKEAVPEPKISWLFKASGSDSSYKTIPGSGAELRIPSAGLLDAGSYRCIASNVKGRDERTVAELEVLMAPVVTIKEGTDVTVKYGSRLALTCKVTANPPATVTWTDDRDNKLFTQVSGSRNEFEYTHVVTNMKESGRYTCRAENNQGIKTESIQVTVTSPVIDPPSHPPDHITVPYGDRVILKCDIKSLLPLRINWYYESATVHRMLISSDETYQISFDNTELNIPSMDQDLSGAYTCKAFLIDNPDVSKSFTTNIDIGGLVPPYIDPKPVYIEVKESDPATIPCIILKGVPKPKISWLMKAAGSTEYRSIAGSGSELRIEKAVLANGGFYKCLTKNPAGHREQIVAELVVLKAPMVTIVEGASLDVPYGNQLTLTCRVTASPEPTVVWKDNAGHTLTATSSTSKNPFEYIHIIAHANVKAYDSGKYSCSGVNTQDSTTESIQVTVSSPFKVISHVPEITTGKYGNDVSLKCDITSNLPMKIRWYYKDMDEKKDIESSEQYTILTNGAELKISGIEVGLDGEYACKASLIEDPSQHVEFTTQLQIDGLEVPEVTGDGNKKVKVGASVSLKCSTIKGVPKPTLSWHFKADSGKFADINNTGNVLHIPKVTGEHAGYYKCIATSSQGTDEHVVALTVEERPVITSEEFTVYEGIEGDVALRIPCDAIGTPKPTFTWKVEGTFITPGTKYAIEDGALIIKNPVQSDSNLYTCKATNSAGSVAKTFKGIVDDTLKHYGTRHNVYVLENHSKTLMCTLQRSSSSLVNWFTQGINNGINKPYMKLEQAQVSNDGFYSCHVSDLNGSATETFVVDVGYPPSFTSQENRVVDWKGDTEHVLRCGVRAKPQPHVEWTFNGKPLVGASSEHLSIFKWGHYSCNVSNVHGAVERDFDVKPSVCMISRKNKETPHMPLMLTEDFTWPDFKTSGEYLIMNPGDKLMLSCHNHEKSPNAFQRFPARSELEATCDNGDTFTVDNRPYQIKHLLCTNDIYPLVVKTNSKCLSETSELIEVGYELEEFVEAYQVCFDYVRNIPLHTGVLMSQSNNFPSAVNEWYQYPGIGNNRAEPYTCETSYSTCCYAKTQLASARDFSYQAAQNSSFIYPLNAVPHWRPCDSDRISWEKVGDMVRSKLDVYPHLVVLSGVHTLREEKGAIIPRYLWKVVREVESKSIAIVYVNDPSPTATDIRCQHNCVSGDVTWLDTTDKYTYCCTVADFIEAFDIPGSVVGETLEASLAKLMPRKLCRTEGCTNAN